MNSLSLDPLTRVQKTSCLKLQFIFRSKTKTCPLNQGVSPKLQKIHSTTIPSGGSAFCSSKCLVVKAGGEQGIMKKVKELSCRKPGDGEVCFWHYCPWGGVHSKLGASFLHLQTEFGVGWDRAFKWMPPPFPESHQSDQKYIKRYPLLNTAHSGTTICPKQ